jgi:hypothetical protein
VWRVDSHSPHVPSMPGRQAGEMPHILSTSWDRVCYSALEPRLLRNSGTLEPREQIVTAALRCPCPISSPLGTGGAVQPDHGPPKVAKRDRPVWTGTMTKDDMSRLVSSFALTAACGAWSVLATRRSRRSTLIASSNSKTEGVPYGGLRRPRRVPHGTDAYCPLLRRLSCPAGPVLASAYFRSGVSSRPERQPAARFPGGDKARPLPIAHGVCWHATRRLEREEGR